VKILVTVKRVPDPEQKPKFKGDALDLSGANWVINTFDEYAVEAALRLNEQADTGARLGEVVVVSVGPKEAATELKKGLAMGADRAIRVDAGDADLDSDVVARILEAVVAQEKPDLVLMGKQAVDGDTNQVAQLLAGRLGWPQATFAAHLELGEGYLDVTREIDAGTEKKRVRFPAVVSVDLRIVAPAAVKNGKTPESHVYNDGPRYPSAKGIMAAKKKPFAETTPAALGVSAKPRVVWSKISAPAARKAGVKVADVPELVRRLKDEAKVL
jgi:electron transfer flavoprotein beta subunit